MNTLPPDDVLGCPVPIARFVARTELAVVALQHVIAYPAGCLLTVHVAVRRGALDDATWERIDSSHAGGFPGPADAGLQFRASEGALVQLGASTSSSDRHYRGDLRLWLTPLPTGPLEFAVEWRRVGLDRTAVTLDGQAIAEAGTRAQPYWP
jgi:hypothetical protein